MRKGEASHITPPGPPPALAPLLRLIGARGACRKMQVKTGEYDPFFPDKGEPTRHAKRICQSCPVRVSCLEYALAAGERFGVFGGLSERERRRLKRERAA